MNSSTTTRPRQMMRPVTPPFAGLSLRSFTRSFRLTFRPTMRLGTITSLAIGLLLVLAVLSSWIPYPVVIAGLMILLFVGVSLAAFVLDDSSNQA